MLSHVILGIGAVERAVEFYDAVLGILGYQRRWLAESGAGYGSHDELGIDTFWLTRPIDGRPGTVGNGTNVAFRCPQSRGGPGFLRKGDSVGAGYKTSPASEPTGGAGPASRSAPARCHGRRRVAQVVADRRQLLDLRSEMRSAPTVIRSVLRSAA